MTELNIDKEDDFYEHSSKSHCFGCGAELTDFSILICLDCLNTDTADYLSETEELIKDQ